MNDAPRRVFHAAAVLLYGGWNLSLLLLLGLGLGVTVLPTLWWATWAGLVHVEATLWLTTVVLAPALFLVLGWRFRRDPGRLLSLLFGVELPALVVGTWRLTAVTQVPAPAATLATAWLVGVGALLVTIAVGYGGGGRWTQRARLGAHVVGAMMGVWFAAVLALPTLVPAMAALHELLARGPVLLTRDPAELFLTVLFAAFCLLTLFAMVVGPLAMVGIALGTCREMFRRVAREQGVSAATTTAAITAVGAPAVLGMVWAAEPSRAWIDRAAGADDDAARREVLAERGAVRGALVDQYLTDERYIQNCISHELGVLEGPWVALMTPLLDPSPPSQRCYGGFAARQDARRVYADVFDTPIERGEREVLVDAMRWQWDWRTAAAGLLDIEREVVHLAAQDVRVEPHGDRATIWLHDTYVNTTFDEHEIAVSFALPETATVSGVWLGDSPVREEANRYIVAPRGAAQEVYERSVRRRIDPALVEQVGPRQYRLRAFPVLPREGTLSEPWELEGAGPELHLWVRFDVLADPDGTWPMPELTEVRNLFWDADTARTLHGEAVGDPTWTWPGSAGRGRPWPIASRSPTTWSCRWSLGRSSRDPSGRSAWSSTTRCPWRSTARPWARTWPSCATWVRRSGAPARAPCSPVRTSTRRHTCSGGATTWCRSCGGGRAAPTTRSC
jgi:putative PEP-CTERM system integral membrane protein